jgi:8-oxo-dGTP diphosphatase
MFIKMIEVCCALIKSENRILAVQRGYESDHPWKWEFPGGKIQLGETAAQCIIREIAEELKIAIKVIGQLEPVEYDYGIKAIRLIPFICQIVGGEIFLTEHVSKIWFGLDEIESIDWQEADWELIVKNKEIVKVFLTDPQN